MGDVSSTAGRVVRLYSRPGIRLLAGIAASALLLALYARGGAFFVLGFVALAPWLLALDGARGPFAALRDGWLMSVAYVLAVLGWFGVAIGAYVGIGALPGLLVALIAAPLLQPQFLAFVLVRQWVGRRHGAAVRALAGACAWVATEWLWPKLLGDTLGHGLHDAALLRQAADLGGAAGLTFVLLLCNEALAAALRRRRDGLRAWAPPVGIALALPLLLAGYGAIRLSTLQAADANPNANTATLRVGMVQTAIVDIERLRREMGAYDVMRLVLDTHFAMSREALEQGDVDALLWSETVYPTTFAQPKSEAGGEFDAVVLGFAKQVRVPMVFGTYDRDAGGEYNAAAFVDPQRGLLGFYRKSRPFPLTEYVPPWLDGPALRRALPWAGTWQPGDGARVMPLFLADGREVPVLPLICLDDVDPQLAIDGARQGAQAILGMSNDSWFSDYPIGAELHLAVARFRSIETRLPQLRVTANGISAVIDAGGEVIARSPMGERALLVGEVRIREPTSTLMLAWGNWLGGVCLAALLLFALAGALARAQRVRTRAARDGRAGAASTDPATYRASATLSSPAVRVAATTLAAIAGLSLLWMGAALLAGDPRANNPLSLLRLFAALVLAPLLAARALRWAHAAQLRIADGHLRIEQRTRTTEIRLDVIEAVQAWRLPFPHSGARLRLKAHAWSPALALADPARLALTLQRAGASLSIPARDAAWAFAGARAQLRRPWLDAPWFKFALFALIPALPAFRLHQIIAYGGPFGEYQTFGLQAYLTALLIWWGQWVAYLAIFAAWIRLLVEATTWAGTHWRPGLAVPLRRWCDIAGRLAYFVGLPLWFAWRLLG